MSSTITEQVTSVIHSIMTQLHNIDRKLQAEEKVVKQMRRLAKMLMDDNISPPRPRIPPPPRPRIPPPPLTPPPRQQLTPPPPPPLTPPPLTSRQLRTPQRPEMIDWDG